MNRNILTDLTLDEAEEAAGKATVVMINHLWFRDEPEYPADFSDHKPDAREGYYAGYVPGFRQAAEEVGVEPELIYAGRRLNSLLAGPDGDWDEIVIVRYQSFQDLRQILNSTAYKENAEPHRLAVIKKWHFFATR